MSDIITIAVSPEQSIEIIANSTLHTVFIDTLYVLPTAEGHDALTIVAGNESGVQSVFSAADMDRWPAWLAAAVPVNV